MKQKHDILCKCNYEILAFSTRLYKLSVSGGQEWILIFASMKTSWNRFVL